MISKTQIKYIQSLHSKKNREQENLFIIEGIKVVTEFINDDNFDIEEVFAVSEFIEDYEVELNKKNITYKVVSLEELQKISLQTTPNKVLATVRSKINKLNTQILSDTLTLFLDDIRDPGNLGTIIRIADWFGIKQIVCSETTTELYNPKTIQASMGAILRVNVVYMPFNELLSYCYNIPLYGAVLKGETIYTKKLGNGIVVIGNEANGISEYVLKHISVPITIPAATNNGSESLNAANACAIICSEFHRQLNY